MKHLKLMGVATILGLSFVSSQAFASSDSSDSSAHKSRPAMHGSGAMRTGSGMHEEGGDMIASYLRTDLTDTEKTAVKTLMEENRTAVKVIMDANGTGTLSDASKASIQSLQTTLVSNLLSYITTDKQAEFSAKFSKVPDFNGKRFNTGKTASGSVEKSRSDDKKTTTTATTKKTSTKKQSTTEKRVSNLIEKKLATFSTDTEKLEWMNTLSTKIDSMLEKVTSASTKKTLKATKTVLEERIDVLDGSDDDSSADSIIQ